MIKCDYYDYIEIACLYKLSIKVQYATHAVAGIALDTQRGENNEEGMLLKVDGEPKWLPLDPIQSISALTPNPHFDKVDFAS